MIRLDTNIDVNKLAEQINGIVEKLTPLAAHVWEVYVRQQYVIGYQQLAMAFLLLVMIAAGACVIAKILMAWQRDEKAWNRVHDEGKRYGEKFDDESYMIGVVVTGVVCLLLIFPLIGFAIDGFGHLANPEYGAIQGLLNR